MISSKLRLTLQGTALDTTPILDGQTDELRLSWVKGNLICWIVPGRASPTISVAFVDEEAVLLLLVALVSEKNSRSITRIHLCRGTGVDWSSVYAGEERNDGGKLCNSKTHFCGW